ncbi:MAG: PilZ domain-containing protein [Desulfuromonadaceae bacterium]|nr:PilZ domain-containing protein [Desulfuromonadaceae bacterium]
MVEKRRYARVNFIDDIEIIHADTRYPGVVTDISMKGVLIKLDEIPSGKVDSDMWLIRLCLAKDVQIVVQAQPSHFDYIHPAVGFSFTAIDVDSMAHLRRLLELNTGNANQIERELKQMVEDMKLKRCKG